MMESDEGKRTERSEEQVASGAGDAFAGARARESAPPGTTGDQRGSSTPHPRLPRGATPNAHRLGVDTAEQRHRAESRRPSLRLFEIVVKGSPDTTRGP